MAPASRQGGPGEPADGPQGLTISAAELDTPELHPRLRPAATRPAAVPGPTPLPRLVVLVDDFDALVAPALGSPGRPAAGSVVRALEAVTREGGRLGVHLIAASAARTVPRTPSWPGSAGYGWSSTRPPCPLHPTPRHRAVADWAAPTAG